MYHILMLASGPCRVFVRILSKNVQIQVPGHVQTVSRICPEQCPGYVQDMSRTVSRVCPGYVNWTCGSRVLSIPVDCPKRPLDLYVYWTSCGQRVLLIRFFARSRSHGQDRAVAGCLLLLARSAHECYGRVGCDLSCLQPRRRVLPLLWRVVKLPSSSYAGGHHGNWERLSLAGVGYTMARTGSCLLFVACCS